LSVGRIKVDKTRRELIKGPAVIQSGNFILKEDTMDITLKERFLELWKRYFNGAELPIAFYYSNDTDDAEAAKITTDHVCVIGVLNKVRKGKSIYFSAQSIGCFGGKRYLGYLDQLRPNFEYFLSTGIPGETEGERYKKSPEIVKEILKNLPVFDAPAKHIIFKRWDLLTESDTPDVVIFYAQPDILSGLFTLAGFDESDPNIVIVPFAAGCGSIVMYPYLEKENPRPRCIMGMMDVSARPFVPSGILTFSAPMEKFKTMVDNMEESFLITSSWKKVRSRIARPEK
jgi:uncharacterized protein (DUF169 family)